eukprot:5413852-Prymnesium_polylepis.1
MCGGEGERSRWRKGAVSVEKAVCFCDAACLCAESDGEVNDDRVEHGESEHGEGVGSGARQKVGKHT